MPNVRRGIVDVHLRRLFVLVLVLVFLRLFFMFSEIPDKQMREWKEVLLHGLPFYAPPDEQQPGQELSSNLMELEKQDILNNQDYDEYTVSGARMSVSVLAAASVKRQSSGDAGKLLYHLLII